MSKWDIAFWNFFYYVFRNISISLPVVFCKQNYSMSSSIFSYAFYTFFYKNWGSFISLPPEYPDVCFCFWSFCNFFYLCYRWRAGVFLYFSIISLKSFSINFTITEFASILLKYLESLLRIFFIKIRKNIFISVVRQVLPVRDLRIWNVVCLNKF